MPRSQVASDNFNRESLGTTDWTQLNSGFCLMQIRSSTLLETSHEQSLDGAGAARWVGAGTFSNDQYAELKINTLPALTTNSFIGVICRASADTDANRDYYFAVVSSDGSGPNYTTVLGKVVNGTRTTLYSATNAWAVNDLISLEVEGSTLRLCKNGTALGGSFTQTDTALTTGKPGITGSGVATTGPSGDDWTAGDMTTGTNVALSGSASTGGHQAPSPGHSIGL